MPRFEDLLAEFFYRPDEDVGALFELGELPEALPPPVPEEAPEEFLAFQLSNETYAIPIGDLREIVKVPPLTEIPRGAPELLGVINLRGEVLPVFDLGYRLRLKDAPAHLAGPEADPASVGRRARILILRLPDADVGVLVDSVQEVVRLRPSTVEPPPAGVHGGERAMITGLGRRREQLFILLDPAQALV